MGNKRIYELAKEWDKSSKEVVDQAQQLGINVKNHMGAITATDEKKLQEAFKRPKQAKQPVPKANQKQAEQLSNEQKKTNEQMNQQKNKSNRNYQDRGQGSGQVNQGKNQSTNKPTNQGKSNQTGGNNQNRQGTAQSNQNRQGTAQS
ncbi:hypothetical protein A5844_000512, partial [Enterococcus sp. 10A9_DIV0425]